jgi:L-2-hydroxyglutarate oxidase LhgO
MTTASFSPEQRAAAEAVDVVVIGAGVVGLAVARALAHAGREVMVLERETAIGTGVSSRNSEVIHAGLYYEPGSLKARLCVRGKDLLYAFCDSHSVNHRRCGKLVVATDDAQLAGLKKIEVRAQANGVPVQWLGGDEVRALEPALKAQAALLSPSTGIVDSHGLMLALQGDLEAAGGAVAVASQVVRGEVVDGGIVLEVLADGEPMWLEARTVVNAAGLFACPVARGIHGLDPRHVPTERYAKGSYFALAGKAPFSRLVYPAPQDAWLGVHLTLDLGGQAKFGPDLEWLPAGQEPLAIDYTVDARRADGFYDEVRRYWPALADSALQPSYSGVRPKLYGPGEPAPDFRIDGPTQHGVPGLVNLFGIESPGLTSALAIGEYVALTTGDKP